MNKSNKKTFASGLRVDFSDEDKKTIDELSGSPGRLGVEGDGRFSGLLESDCPKEISDFVLPET